MVNHPPDMYHHPDSKNLPNDLQDLFSQCSICIADLNAMHPTWGYLSEKFGSENVISKKCEVGLFANDVVIWDFDTDLRK
ncbi:hypothetical protein CEXT_813441 [Caerostris extrusa]|uniref:Endonuclease/exonuclease/phosphatase domain-containing protein n=1 Tax=Caerostris extrusa TaxID=172846 RepID=A0AAV4U0G6_CAEEX|nr:hypothetical protein CEXT_813441 [Caerostris extrusa]